MEFWQAFVLALIQGLTEFLPISSSAHLILPSQVLGWPDQGLIFDVGVHFGTLIAVVAYYRRDVWQLTLGALDGVRQRAITPPLKLAVAIVIATVPAGVVGLLGSDWIETNLRSMVVIAMTTVGFGVLLGWAYYRMAGSRVLDQLQLWDAWWIGAAQALALIPGTSRSGITITAALMLGFSPQASARFSFLISIPVIALAGGLEAHKAIELFSADQWDTLLLGVVVSGLSAYCCIAAFIAWLDRIGMMPFVIYRLILGGVLLSIWWFV